MQNTITADAFYTNSFGDVVPVMSDQAVLISGEIIFEQDLAEIFEEDIDRTFTLADLTSEQARRINRALFHAIGLTSY